MITGAMLLAEIAVETVTPPSRFKAKAVRTRALLELSSGTSSGTASFSSWIPPAGIQQDAVFCLCSNLIAFRLLQFVHDEVSDEGNAESGQCDHLPIKGQLSRFKSQAVR